MRKFKFMSKAVVGMMAVAMTMGSLSGVTFRQPIGVYAATGDFVATADKLMVTTGAEVKVALSAGVEQEDGTVSADNGAIFAVKDGATLPTGVTYSNGVLTIASAYTVTESTTITMTATGSGDNNTKTDDVTITIVPPTSLITLSAAGNATTIEPGGTLGFSVTGFSGAENETITFTALDDQDRAISGVTIPSGEDKTQATLTVTSDVVADTEIIVKAEVATPAGTKVSSSLITITVTNAGGGDDEEEEYTITATPDSVTEGVGGTVSLSATDSSDTDVTADLTFEVSPAYTGATVSNHTLTITEDAEAGTVVIVAKKNGTQVGTVNVTISEEGGGDGPTASVTTSTIDYSNMTLTVKSTDPYFTVDVLKTESDKAKPSKSYTYTNTDKVNGVVIDLGFLKLKKENILNVYGSGKTAATGTIVKVAAQPDKETLKITAAAKGTLMEAMGKTVADGSLYQYRSSFGSDWVDASGFKFEAAKVAGTTIVVRKKAVTTGSAQAPAGPEVKVKIPAAAKAPKVAIDYVKDNIKVTDKMQIALLNGSNPVAESAWKDAAKGMTRAAVAEKLEIPAAARADEFKMVVRTKASNNKFASMPVIVTVKARPTITKSGNTISYTVGSTTATISAQKDKDGNTVFTTTNTSGTLSFQYDKGGGKWTAIPTKAVKNLSSPVKVRLAPAKEDKNTVGSGAFPSQEEELPIQEAAKDKATAPSVSGDTVSIGGTAVLKISRDTDNTTIKFAVQNSKTNEAKTLQYSIGEAAFADITDDILTGGVPDQQETALTIKVRVKGTTEKDPSDPATVTVPAAQQ